ncbi:MAG: polysaccharide deacetylase family protein [Actinomycetota bacterium]
MLGGLGERLIGERLVGPKLVGAVVVAGAAILAVFVGLDRPPPTVGTTTESVAAGDTGADNGDAVDQGSNPAGASARDAAPALAVKVDDQDGTDPAATGQGTDSGGTTAVPDSTVPTDGSTTTAGPTGGDKPVIHLTFDDGPSELTPRVLDLVERYNGRATFFVMGSAVEDHPDIAREIVDRGHAIANHSYDHMDWRQPGAREDAIRTQEIITDTTGVVPSCARPPFGAQDENLLSILSSLGMTSWRWDLSAEDHTDARYRVEETLNTIDDIPNIRGAEGKIFLQHDSDLLVSPTIDGLEDWLAKNGDRYEFKVIDGCLDYQ